MKRLNISRDDAYLADLAGSNQLIKALNNKDFEENITWEKLQKLQKDYADDLANQLPQLTPFVFNLTPDDLAGAGLPKTWFKNIGSISFQSPTEKTMTWADVQTLIKDCSHLKSLNLKACKNLGNLPEDMVFPESIESLDLSSTGATWKEIQQLIKDRPHLKSLHLSSCINLGILPEAIVFPKSLESLGLFGIERN